MSSFCDQYRKFIFSRFYLLIIYKFIVITLKNFTITQRTAIGAGYTLFFVSPFSETAVYSFSIHNEYEVDQDSGKHGMNAATFRSFSEDDAALSLHSSISDRSIKLGLVDGGSFRKKIYYKLLFSAM